VILAAECYNQTNHKRQETNGNGFKFFRVKHNVFLSCYHYTIIIGIVNPLALAFINFSWIFFDVVVSR